jgi:CRP-like cAMP-binding protein
MPADGDRAAILALCSLFSEIPLAEQRSLAASATLRHIEPGKPLFVEGDRCEGLWIVGSGRVKLHHANQDGDEFVLGFPPPGSPLVLWALLDQKPLTASATALSAVTAVVIPTAEFLDVVRHHPEFASRIISHLCSQLRQRDISAGLGALQGARGRLACRLLQLVRQYGDSSNHVTCIEYPLTRRDLARTTGVTIETAVRLMGRLREEGIVETVNRRIVIPDLEALRDTAACSGCLYDCSVFDPDIACTAAPPSDRPAQTK